MTRVWILWDQDDYYTDVVVGVYATYDAAVRAEVEYLRDGEHKTTLVEEHEVLS